MENKKPEAPKEEALPTIADLKKMVDDYAIPMSQGTLEEMSKDLTPEKAKAFEDYVKTAAQGLYPTLATQIKAGIPTKMLLEPYRQLGKQMLGDDFEPDFQGDPKSMQAVVGGHDPATGRPAPMSLSEWRTHIMKNNDFGWWNTPAAQQVASNFGDAMRQGFDQAPQDRKSTRLNSSH